MKKCLLKQLCSNFNDYFTINVHNKVTRNNSSLLKIPKIKLECTKKAFFYMGTKIYNNLPLDIRKIDDFKIFKLKLDEYFK